MEWDIVTIPERRELQVVGCSSGTRFLAIQFTKDVFDVAIDGMIREMVDLKFQQTSKKAFDSIAGSPPAADLL